MIHVDGLTKTYQVHRREPGLRAALRSLIHRSYEPVHAVSGIAFSIKPGERVGFLGPNGAGKTTTLKMLTGLLHPTSGTLEVAGFHPARREVAFLKSITLVMGHKQQLLWDLPPSDTFAMNRAIYEIPQAEYRETLAELTALLELGELVRRPTRQLSLGERMKCELAAALLHRPKVLFLDEPTIGLDVNMQSVVRSFIRQYNERFGAVVLLTSHYMEDVEALCPRVLVIDRGRLRFDGALATLVQQQQPRKRLTLRLAAAVGAGRWRQLAEEQPFRVESGADGTTGEPVVIEVDNAALRAVVSALLTALPVADLSIEPPPIESALRSLFSATQPPPPSGR